MSLSARRELIASTAPRYQQSSKAQKGVILGEFVSATGYERKYAIVLLNRTLDLNRTMDKSPAPCPRRRRRPTYGPDVRHALTSLWKLSGGQCGKLLVGALPHLIERLKVFGEWPDCPPVERALAAISAATIDRLLHSVRRPGPRGRSTTRAGTLLKHQIPVRTFADWDDLTPGFAEVDLVAHCGEDAGGDFAYTLTLTDIATGWVELVALRNRSQVTVTEALKQVRRRLPFPLRGIDCDNGSEFINAHLLRYCTDRRITFTRSRPYRKNDQCYVEQKNGHVVRRLAGYARYEGAEAVEALDRLYRQHRQLLNFFQPCRQLLKKTREGAKVKKEYDAPRTPYQRTPYQRTLDSGLLSGEGAAGLTALCQAINPAQVRRREEELGHALAKQAVKASGGSPGDPGVAAVPG